MVVTISELGTTRPCSCGKTQVLGVVGEYATIMGKVLACAWWCDSCQKKDYAGVLSS